jgi:lipopolysaccharide exporter
MNPGAKVPISPGRQMLHGSVWLIGLRWTVRLTGVVSTVILARLLSPNDFGIVAIAMIVVGLFEMLSWTGQELAIIRHATPTSEHYDTAWTISAIIGFAIAGLIFAVAPFATQYFHDVRSVAVIQCLSLRPLLSGLENVGMVDFQRSLRFDRVFSYNFYSKVIAFFVTIILAFFLRNYWALVAGILVGQMARTILSYLLHPYRPRISFSKRSEIWSFSIWSLARAIGTYFITQVDVIAIGGIAGATSMGRYTVAKDVASSPVDELNEPVSAVLFPVMARYQAEPVQLRQLYLRTLGWAAVIGASTGVGVTMVAQDMVPIILGTKWIDITPLMGWLALTAGLAALTNSSFTILDIIGLPHVGARMQWFRVALLALVLFPVAYATHSLARIAEARLIMTIVFVPSLLLAAGREVSVTAKDYVWAIWRPVTAGGVMALALWLLNNSFRMGSIARLPLDVAMGAVSFSVALLCLWHWSEKPASAESDIVGLYEAGRTKIAVTLSRVLKTGQ